VMLVVMVMAVMVVVMLVLKMIYLGPLFIRCKRFQVCTMIRVLYQFYTDISFTLLIKYAMIRIFALLLCNQLIRALIASSKLYLIC
jgi:hypothetical protein